MIEIKLFIHQIELNVSTDNTKFIEYIKDYFSPQEISLNNSCDLNLSLTFNSNLSLNKILDKSYKKLGTDLYQKGKNEFIVNSGHDLWLHLTLDVKCISVQVFDQLNKKKNIYGFLRYGESYRYQRFMYIIRQAVLLPSFYLYYTNKHYITWHASAVNIYGKTLGFTGLNGSGKSGLLMHFMNKIKQAKIISDNFLLINSSGNFLSVPEPVRMDQNCGEFNFLQKKVCKAFGKIQYTPKKDFLIKEGIVDFMFSVELGPKAQIIEVKSEDFTKRMFSLHSFLSETPEHNYFEPIAYLYEGEILSEIWKNTSKKFCSTTPCYILQLPFEKDLSMRYNKIHDIIEKLIIN